MPPRHVANRGAACTPGSRPDCPTPWWDGNLPHSADPIPRTASWTAHDRHAGRFDSSGRPLPIRGGGGRYAPATGSREAGRTSVPFGVARAEVRRAQHRLVRMVRELRRAVTRRKPAASSDGRVGGSLTGPVGTADSPSLSWSSVRCDLRRRRHAGNGRWCRGGRSGVGGYPSPIAPYADRGRSATPGRQPRGRAVPSRSRRVDVDRSPRPVVPRSGRTTSIGSRRSSTYPRA